jgi:hypothetical protein
MRDDKYFCEILAMAARTLSREKARRGKKARQGQQ